MANSPSSTAVRRSNRRRVKENETTRWTHEGGEQEKMQQFGRGGMYGGKLAAVAAASPVGNEWR